MQFTPQSAFINIKPMVSNQLASGETTTAFNNTGVMSTQVNASDPNIDDAKVQISDFDEYDRELDELTSQFEKFDWKADVVQAASNMVDSNSTEVQHQGVLKFKKMLCKARQQVFRVADDVIKAGVLPRLVHFVKDSRIPEMRLAASFCLTNVAAGDDDQTDAVVACGAVPVLMDLLESEDPLLRRQAIFCLANIAGSTMENRALLVQEHEYCRRVVDAAERCDDPKVITLASWNLRNICVLPGVDFVHKLFAIEHFVRVFCGDRKNMDYLCGDDLERYASESLAVTCKTPDGLKLVLSQNDDVIGAALDTARRTPTSRLLVFDILNEVASGDANAKDAMFQRRAETILCEILRDRTRPIDARIKSLEVLAALAGGKIATNSMRLISPISHSWTHGHLQKRLPEESFFARVHGVDPVNSFSPLDLAMDVWLERGGSEEPPLRHLAALFVSRIISAAPAESIATNNRIGEIVSLLLEIIDFDGGINTARSTQINGNGTSASTYSEQPGDVEWLYTSKNVNQCVQASENMVAEALDSLDNLLTVGELFCRRNGLPENPVLMMMEQLGASNRIREILRRTQSLLVSEKVVTLLSRHFVAYIT